MDYYQLLTLDQLEIGRSYELIVSTLSGLYRYQTHSSRGDRHLGYSSRHTQVSLPFASDYRDCSIFMK